MHFLYPVGLLALAGLFMPVLIHLWNTKKGKTLKIGSIALLSEIADVSSRSFKINEWILLLLRCLLIGLLAIFLSEPIVEKIVPSHQVGGWIMMDKADAQEIYRENKKTLDSLLSKGFELHDFNVGFKTFIIKESTPSTSGLRLPHTTLLKQVNQSVPIGTKVYLFADARLQNFGDSFPKLTYQLIWKKTLKSDTLRNWSTNYAGKGYSGRSSPSATTYQPSTEPLPPPIRVAIHASQNDRKYIVAALNAMESFTKRKIILNPPSGSVDVGFWLAERSPTANFIRSIQNQGTLFQYEMGKLVQRVSKVEIEGEQVNFSKTIAQDINYKPLWRDNLGNPILAEQITGDLRILHFYSRLNPQWTDLVWDQIFVQSLMPIVIRDNKASDFGFEDYSSDQRTHVIEKSLLRSNSSRFTGPYKDDQEINIYFWCAALVIFTLERFLSFKKYRYARN